MLNLQEQIDAGQLEAEIAVVVASRPCRGLERAKAAGLTTQLVPFRDFRPAGEQGLIDYSNQITGALDRAGVDLVLLAGFLSPWLAPDRYAGRAMNIHPALLPCFGGQGMYGQRVHEAVLAAGCKISGCTVHFVTNEYDAGPIILQRAVPAYAHDTPESLAARVFQQECIAYPQAIQLFADGRLCTRDGIVRIRPSSDS